MSFMPFQVVGIWLRPLLSLVLLCLGLYLLAQWYEHQKQIQPRGKLTRLDQDDSEFIRNNTGASNIVADDENSHITSRIGFNLPTAMLVAGLASTFWVLGGWWILSFLFLPTDLDPPTDGPAGAIERLIRPDGTELHVECFGPVDGIPLVLTHGWGLDSKEWVYARKELSNRCRVIVWDLPGLGRSKGPSNKDWSLEKLATDLDAIIQFSGSRPVLLGGHSIGGMIILTYCKLFPTLLSSRVAGVIIGQSTFTNPVETTSMAWFYRSIQKPVLEPLCYFMIALAPMVWLMNWWSYLTGSIHRTNHKSFFSGKESREQLGFISRYGVQSWPAVVARGFLAMFRFDATATLTTIPVPTVIVYGSKDMTCTPEASMTMSEAIPNARLVTLGYARHGGVFEFHHQFAEAIHQMISTSLKDVDSVAGDKSIGH